MKINFIFIFFKFYIMKKLGYIIFTLISLSFMVSCGFFQQNIHEISTIDSNNFYQVFDSAKYRTPKPVACSDSIYISKGSLYTITKLKAANLDSNNMSELSFKLFVTYSNLIESIMMNSKDSTIILVHHKYCLTNYEIMENLVMNGAILVRK